MNEIKTHYLKGLYPSAELHDCGGKRRKRLWTGDCSCGFSVSAYGKQLAICKIMGHQETCNAGYLLVEEAEKKERGRWIKACAYHGIKIEQPQQLKRIISQFKRLDIEGVEG